MICITFQYNIDTSCTIPSGSRDPDILGRLDQLDIKTDDKLFVQILKGL